MRIIRLFSTTSRHSFQTATGGNTRSGLIVIFPYFPLMRKFGDFTPEFTRADLSKIYILPVPYDETSTYMKGADKGPEALLNASPNLEFYDIETDTEVFRHGIFTAPAVKEKRSPEKMVDAVYKAASYYLAENKFIVMLGGEHSVSAGCIKAHKEKYPNLSVLQLDAHSDLRPEYEGSIYNHACIMARAREMCPITQVGIRSMDVVEKPYIDPERVFFAERIRNQPGWMEKAVNTLSEDVYITIDLDVFDPSILPSTGTPEPGGLDWYTVTDLLRNVVQNKNVVGFDIVELCPNPKMPASDFIAAKLLYKLLTLVFNKK